MYLILKHGKIYLFYKKKGRKNKMTTTKNPWNDILTTTHEGKKVIVARDDWEIIQTILESEKKGEDSKNTELHLNFELHPKS